MRLFYTLGIRLYALGIRIASVWNPKAKLWIKGRENWEKQFENYIAESDTYWFHCASLGEFEQGLPVMELLKAKGNKIVVSFFSPSGYEIKKNHPISNWIFYLPIDTKKNAEKIISILQPKAIVFVKYEFWANLILTAREKNIKLSLIVGLFREGQIFFKPTGGLMRRVLGSFDHILVQNRESQAILETIKINSIITGDTRFDRVNSNLSKPKNYPKIESYIAGKKVLVLGSVWKEDLDIIGEFVNELSKDWSILLAPHNIDENTVKIMMSYFNNSGCYTDDEIPEQGVYIINTMGMLQHLYRYGHIAYIGGGFKTGLHNILEPAVFGLPVIFGNQVDKFPEAKQFTEAGIGSKISSAAELKISFEKFTQNDFGDKVKDFVHANLGASEKTAKIIS
ncbi:MAG: 3-deoxy-D-manno-octulosonic acid transferase [Crocinitomicaceae bacterium]|nr:3-deoxy-D-manno-octulosonic acid transferase [Crocinitomicaceae bacterium]